MKIREKQRLTQNKGDLAGMHSVAIQLKKNTDTY